MCLQRPGSSIGAHFFERQ